MKRKTSSRSAFFTVRSVTAFLLCVVGFLFALFALGARIDRPSKKVAAQDVRRGGGGAPLSNSPSEQSQSSAQSAAATPYTGPQHDSRPVAAVRSGELRQLKPIHPSKAPKHDHPEPIRPTPPGQNGGPEGALQTAEGQQFSAPSPAGTGFDGIGNGLGGFVPSSNPPDVNGRVGATQFVQWNNSSFAVFDKATGALQYGPAAGNTLFQSLGGVCASHNDGDPVVSYDILAGRWVLSQFVVGGPSGSYSHQCVAV